MKSKAKKTKEIKSEMPLYYECIKTSTCESFTKGKIYKIIDANDLEARCNFIDNFYEPNGFSELNHKYFKPSTLNKYLIQEGKLEEIKLKKKAIEEKIKKISKGIAKGFSLNEQRKKQIEIKKELKKAPTTLFGMQIRHNPKAHKFSVAMAMVGLNTDISSADLILRLFDKIEEMGGKFDISSAVDLQLKVKDEYEVIRKEFEKTNQ